MTFLAIIGLQISGALAVLSGLMRSDLPAIAVLIAAVLLSVTCAWSLA